MLTWGDNGRKPPPPGFPAGPFWGETPPPHTHTKKISYFSPPPQKKKIKILLTLGYSPPPKVLQLPPPPKKKIEILRLLVMWYKVLAALCEPKPFDLDLQGLPYGIPRAAFLDRNVGGVHPTPHRGLRPERPRAVHHPLHRGELRAPHRPHLHLWGIQEADPHWARGADRSPSRLTRELHVYLWHHAAASQHELLRGKYVTYV